MLKKCISHFKWLVIAYVGLGFVEQFFNSMSIVYFQKILDLVSYGRVENHITTILTVYGLLLVGICVVSYVKDYPAVKLENGIFERLKIMALSKISKINYKAYQEIGTGEMIKVIENGAAAGQNMIFSFYLRICHELLPTIIFSLLFISFYDLKIMALIILGYVVIFFITNVLLKFLYNVKSSLLKDQEDSSKYSIRGFMELVVFRTNKRYGKEIRRLENIAGRIVNKNAKIKMIHESFFAIFAFLITLIKIGVLFTGISSVIRGEISIGVIVAIIMFIDKVYTPIAIFNVIFVEYKLNKVAYKRFESFLSAPEDKNLDRGYRLTGTSGEIEFKNVSFAYDQQEVLSNVAFRIKPGEKVALVGLSGSGKSTIVKLLVGLLKKHKGEILWDGKDIDSVALNSLYDSITYIPQEPPIFDTTIRENITLDHADHVSDEYLYAILDQVHLKAKVSSLPEKLDTHVGERGIKLSGGEKQRLAFARAIYQDKKVLILDEPVSALDNITENSIMNRLLETCQDKTLIIVAHRLNFVKNVDKILVVKHGRIVGQGDFEYLLEHCDEFRELWNKQSAANPSSLHV